MTPWVELVRGRPECVPSLRHLGQSREEPRRNGTEAAARPRVLAGRAEPPLWAVSVVAGARSSRAAGPFGLWAVESFIPWGGLGGGGCAGLAGVAADGARELGTLQGASGQRGLARRVTGTPRSRFAPLRRRGARMARGGHWLGAGGHLAHFTAWTTWAFSGFQETH